MNERIILLDTSTAVALCTDDHVAQDSVIAAIGNRQTGLAGHAWFETFSVLTRLPPPQRATATYAQLGAVVEMIND